MASTFTPNLGFEEPARGDLVGMWDTPWNNNTSLLDAVTGGIATISLNNSNVVLSAAQYESKTLIFNSTLTGSVLIIFPSSFIKSYEIKNLCTGSSAFYVALTTGITGSVTVGAPPGETVNITNDGTNVQYRNFGHIGEYWDYAGTTVPVWFNACSLFGVLTVPPYLNCNGTTFASSTYPQLAGVMGTTTLPDSRGRTRFVLNQATGRITAGISGVDGNTRSAAGGIEYMQAHNHGVNDPGHTHGHNANAATNAAGNATGGAVQLCGTAGGTVSANGTGIGLFNAGAGGSQNMPPAYVGGLTFIRAG